MINRRMEKPITECDKHLQRMSYAYTKMTLFMPLDISRYQQLSDDEVEQIGLIEDKNIWLELRKLRNNMAHQYEDEPKQASEALNAIYAVKPTLESIYKLIKTQYVEIRDSASLV